MTRPSVQTTPASGLLGWLGFGRGEEDGPEHQPRACPGQQARALLLERISDFLLDNDLEVTAANLATAHAACAGLNPRLERRVRRRVESGEAITQAWLDRAIAADEPAEDVSLDKLAQQLSSGIDKFSRSTQSARTNAANYGDALAEHVDALEAVPGQSDVVASLADYARAMLERSRKAEAELRMAEEEAVVLRHNLDRARRDAEIDFLTGLPNRRAFEDLLEREYREARAAVEPLCVAFCDIDRFKQVNDRHGHDAGDRVICVVAEMLAEISGEKCHIARHGGEEFVLLLRGMKLEEACALLDTTRRKMAARKLLNRRNQQPFGQVTFSGGIADIFAHGGTRPALKAADEALYEAKESGRNRICMAPSPA
ncbi:GGDEF domain-containing protein [Aurantiacibacter poecillastricola]|uniref:GGDEF domain-containing protein n=1 Tax=Aurantiacibacter poecillastricola TaxID=3064385 RepID=UPI00273D277B|nr:GGDEF domain-containing protein [Aurantiacibacter sp. 219JJ12-13]MDP5262499.1 GGDEF domain-containing protein [Aurantiacibacter sp. 219JJ12-13]